MNPGGVYVRIWEFVARPEAQAEFENFYGPDGEWVQLFRRSKAFVRTEFFRDLKRKDHYVTVDSFVSQAGYEDFLREFRREYEELDRRCDGVRQSEREIGTFTALDGSVICPGA